MPPSGGGDRVNRGARGDRGRRAPPDRAHRRQPRAAAASAGAGDGDGRSRPRSSRPGSALHATKQPSIVKQPSRSRPGTAAGRRSSGGGGAAAASSPPAPSPPPAPPPPPPSASSDTVYRLLVETRLAGLVIGKAGSGIGAIRASTGARVRVIDALPAAPERAVVVWSSPAAGADGARDALLAVFDAHQAARAATDGPAVAAASCCARLLICRSQAGAIIGRGGAGLADLRAVTGARAVVHPAEALPPAALATDRLVSIDGDVTAVRSALAAVAATLRHHPPTVPPGGGACALVVTTAAAWWPAGVEHF